MEVGKRDRSRRGLLQRLAGDVGTVLPRVDHGTMRRPAQGWYIIVGDREVFLGDYSGLAELKLEQLKRELANGNGKHA